jgi:hypothetical protein
VIGDHTKIDNLVQVLSSYFRWLRSFPLSPGLTISLADRSQRSNWKVLHDLWTSRDCWFCNVCLLSFVGSFLITGVLCHNFSMPVLEIYPVEYTG